jgi:glutathione peroxidase
MDHPLNENNQPMKAQNKWIRALKKTFIVLLMLLITFSGYVALATRNTKDMTVRQRILKSVYPALMWWNKVTGSGKKSLHNDKTPPVDFYSLTTVLNNGDSLALSSLKGKKVLLVNTASDCGYTDQYGELQQLYDQFKDKLVIIGFPANDFKEQEKGTDETISAFCKKNYGISFPLARKISVRKGTGQDAVFQWLSDPAKNGWNVQAPTWNFCKYLVNENGVLTHFFPSAVSPMSPQVTDLLK